MCLLLINKYQKYFKCYKIGKNKYIVIFINKKY